MDKSVFVIESFPALGTLFWIELFQDDEHGFEESLLQTIATRLSAEIKSFEALYSRFRTETTLSLLNRERVVSYDKDLWQMIELADKMGVVSDEVFDIFIKEKLEEKGYGEAGNKIQENIKEKNFVICDGKHIKLHGSKGIDLGGIGKGYLIDKLAKILQDEYSIPYFLINGGGDMYITSKHEEMITVYLEHPMKHDEYIGTVQIKNKSFCSSSSFKRTWKHEGKEVNHFIGEREVWAASYVIGIDTVTSDMFATVACILSSDKEKLDMIATTLCVDYMVINQYGDIYASEGFQMIEV